MQLSNTVKILSVLSVSAAMIFGATPAFGDTPDEIDEALVLTTSDYLGLQELAPELTALLVEGIDLATDADVVNTSVLQTITDSLSEEAAADDLQVSADTGDEITGSPLQQVLDQQLEGDQQLWDEMGPLWLSAFESIRSDFEACRVDGETTSQCARTFAFSLQVAQAEEMLAMIDLKISEISSLPEDEQVIALEQLDADRAALEARLVRAEARLVSVEQGVTTQQAARLASAMATVRERAAVTRSSDVAEETRAGEQPGAGNNQSATPAPQPGLQNAPGQQPRADQNSQSPQPNANQGARPTVPGNSGNAGNSGSARP